MELRREGLAEEQHEVVHSLPGLLFAEVKRKQFIEKESVHEIQLDDLGQGSLLDDEMDTVKDQLHFG